MPERYITYSEGPDEDALKEALNKAIELCVSLKHNTVIIHVPTIGSLNGIIKDVLGEALVKKLSKDKSIVINSIKFLLNTKSIKINNWTEDIILSIHPTSEMFDNLNDLNKAKAIVVVPWTEEERDAWIKTWNLEIIGEHEIEIETAGIDTILEKALSILTGMVNLSSSLTHPSDKDKTIQLLQVLKKKGIDLNPDNIKIWALRNGWNSNAASKLYKFTEGILKGKKFKTTGQNIWTDKIIDKIFDN